MAQNIRTFTVSTQKNLDLKRKGIYLNFIIAKHNNFVNKITGEMIITSLNAFP